MTSQTRKSTQVLMRWSMIESTSEGWDYFLRRKNRGKRCTITTSTSCIAVFRSFSGKKDESYTVTTTTHNLKVRVLHFSTCPRWLWHVYTRKKLTGMPALASFFILHTESWPPRTVGHYSCFNIAVCTISFCDVGVAVFCCLAKTTWLHAKLPTVDCACNCVSFFIIQVVEDRRSSGNFLLPNVARFALISVELLARTK